MTKERLKQLKDFLDNDYILSLENGAECLAEIEQLRQAVDKYATHLDNCPEEPCICGLENLLKDIL